MDFIPSGNAKQDNEPMPRTAITINFTEMANVVDKWRSRTVEVARNGVPPHITLLFPWMSSPVAEHDIETIAGLCRQIKPFSIEFNQVRYFESGTVYLSLTDCRQVLDLSKKIWAAYPDTPPYGGQHRDPIPHLTIAQGDKRTVASLHEDVTTGLGDWLPHNCDVSAVSLLTENDHGQWQVLANLAMEG